MPQITEVMKDEMKATVHTVNFKAIQRDVGTTTCTLDLEKH